MRLKPAYQGQRHDYHAHTKYSDGALTIEESVKKRMAYADVIGISDHYRYLIADGDKLKTYCDEIEQVRDDFNKSYEKKNDIKLGVEIFLADIPYAINNLTKYPFDFIIIENFEYFIDQHEVVRILETLLEAFQVSGIQKIPIEIILAHPDFEVWFNHLIKEDNVGVDKMLTFLHEHDIALEINIKNGYFLKENSSLNVLGDMTDSVVEILKRNETFLSIGTDCHSYEDELFVGFVSAYEYFEKQY